MPFMSGIVVSKQLFKTLCRFELAFVFLTPTTVETGTVTVWFLVSTVTFHTVKYGTHQLFFANVC